MSGSEDSSNSRTRLGSVDNNYYPTVPQLVQLSDDELNEFLSKTNENLSCLVQESVPNLRENDSFQTSFEAITQQLNNIQHEIKRTFREPPETLNPNNYRCASKLNKSKCQ